MYHQGLGFIQMESIAIGADHAGFPLKEAITAYFRENNIPYEDLGTFNGESVDYPSVVAQVIQAMEKNGHTKAVLCCGSGIGVSIAANRYPKVRAALANDLYSAQMSRLHNDANVLCMGSRIIAPALALEILKVWLSTPFEGGRHQRRVDLIDDLSQKGVSPC